MITWTVLLRSFVALILNDIAMSLTYREEHEAFISNLKGTSITCILVVLAHVPACVLLLKLVQGNRQPRFVRDITFLILPLLCSMTVLSSHGYWSLPCLVSIGYVTATFQRNRRKQQFNSASTSDDNHASSMNRNLGRHPAYLSLFKGANLLITCMAILAVDFKIFPRRFAKTETFGIGLMDLGVGTFIVASGITSAYAQSPSRRVNVNVNHAVNGTGMGRSRMWRRLAVLALGVARTLAVKLLGYQEHVSEYGVHWNFFLSLYCVWIISDGIHYLVPRALVVWLALVMIVLYQTVLVMTPLTDYILRAPRNNMFSANREGLFSLLGYVPLYLLSEVGASRIFFVAGESEMCGCGDVLEKEKSSEKIVMGVSEKMLLEEEEGGSRQQQQRQSQNMDESQDDVTVTGTATGTSMSTANETSTAAVALSCGNVAVEEHLGARWRLLARSPLRSVLLRLSVCVVVLWLGWAAGTSVQATSRRLANLPFVFLVLTLCTVLILLLLVADVLGGPATSVATLEYLSDVQLPVFLCANVLTGVVNMKWRTLYIPALPSFLLLSAYSICVCVLAWIFAHRLNRRTAAP